MVAPLAAAAPSSVAASPAPQVMVAPADTAERASGAGSAAAMLMATDPSGLITRVKNILLTPSTEWPVIAAESSSARTIYFQYVAPLVAIGAIATFIGQTMIGVTIPLVGQIRVPMIAGLGSAVLSFLLAFLGVFLIALLVDGLAPTFGGVKDPLRALKVTVYSYTPAWVAGVLHVIPWLGVISVLGAFYGLYLLYLGLPVLMRCPKEKALGYTVVLVICAIVLGMAIAAVTAVIMGGVGLGAMSAVSGLSKPKLDERVATENAAGALAGIFGGKSDADKARVNEALQQLARVGAQAEQAERAAKATGNHPSTAAANAVDVNAALGAVGQIMSGGKDVQPVDFHRLKDMLPDSLAGMKRDEATGQSGEAMGMKGSSATGHYSNGSGGRVSIEIADMGSLAGLAGLAARFDPKMEKETATGYERTSKVNGQIVHERYDRASRAGEISIMSADRFTVTVHGSGVDADVLAAALKRVDLPRLGTLAAR